MSQLFGMDFFNPKADQTNQVARKNDKIEHTKNTLGAPKLSDTAANYYEELKAKYKDVEFVLVDDTQTANAKEHAANVHSDKSMIVLISENEVEAMATDETTRAKNEQLISDGIAKMPSLLKQLEEADVEVKSFGMEFGPDGTISYFAVLNKSSAAQKERIEKKLEEKRTEDKHSEPKVPDKNKRLSIVSASTMEDLIKKINDILYEEKADTIMTEQEKMVGQHFDAKF